MNETIKDQLKRLVDEKVHSLNLQARACRERAEELLKEADLHEAQAVAEIAKFERVTSAPCDGCNDKKKVKK